jgi:hypothetical protein
MSDLTPEQRRRLEASLEPTRTVQILNLADVTPRNPKFLWYPYMPLGKLVIVAGAPGNGKSQLAALIAAMATRGALYPGDVAETSRVCMMCAEDDLDDTVVPRLLAVNADLRLIDTINVKTDYPNGLTSTGMIGIPGDVDSVHRWAREHAPIGAPGGHGPGGLLLRPRPQRALQPGRARRARAARGDRAEVPDHRRDHPAPQQVRVARLRGEDRRVPRLPGARAVGHGARPGPRRSRGRRGSRRSWRSRRRTWSSRGRSACAARSARSRCRRTRRRSRRPSWR